MKPPKRTSGISVGETKMVAGDADRQRPAEAADGQCDQRAVARAGSPAAGR